MVVIFWWQYEELSAHGGVPSAYDFDVGEPQRGGTTAGATAHQGKRLQAFERSSAYTSK